MFVQDSTLGYAEEVHLTSIPVLDASTSDRIRMRCVEINDEYVVLFHHPAEKITDEQLQILFNTDQVHIISRKELKKLLPVFRHPNLILSISQQNIKVYCTQKVLKQKSVSFRIPYFSNKFHVPIGDFVNTIGDRNMRIFNTI